MSNKNRGKYNFLAVLLIGCLLLPAVHAQAATEGNIDVNDQVNLTGSMGSDPAPATPSNANEAPYKPTLSGTNSLSGTLGNFTPLSVWVTVSNSYSEKIPFKATIGDKTVTATQFGNGPIEFVFKQDQLNRLLAGEYPIFVSSEATLHNEAISKVQVGTVSVLKYSPSVSGRNELNGTIGSVGSQEVNVTLEGAGFGPPLKLKAEIGGEAATCEVKQNGPLSFSFASDDLAALSVGRHNISVSTEETDFNERIQHVEVGTLEVHRARPVLGSGGDCSGKQGAIGAQTFTGTLEGAYFGGGILRVKATLNELTKWIEVTNNGTVSFEFTAEELNALRAGVYPVEGSFAGDEYNEAATQVIGVLTVTGTDQYTVKLQNQTGGAATATPDSGPEGTAIKLSAVPEPGYRFVRWEVTPDVTWTQGDAAGADAVFELPASDVTVTPVYEAPRVYSVNLSQQTGGAATATPGSGPEGTAIKLNAVPEPGYRFVRWEVAPDVTWTQGDAAGADAVFELPASDVTVTPVYEAPRVYSVNLSQQTGGAATATPTGGLPGTRIVLSAVPDTGYTFDCWVTSCPVTWTQGNAQSAQAAFALPDADMTVTPAYTYHEPAKDSTKARRARPDITVSLLQSYAFPTTGALNKSQIKLRPGPGTDNRPVLTRGKIGQTFTIVDLLIPSAYQYGFYKVEWEGQPGFTYLALDYADVTFDPPLEGRIVRENYAFVQAEENRKYRAMKVRRDDRVRLVARTDKWWIAEIEGQEVFIPAWNVTFDFKETNLGISEEAAF